MLTSVPIFPCVGRCHHVNVVAALRRAEVVHGDGDPDRLGHVISAVVIVIARVQSRLLLLTW